MMPLRCLVTGGTGFLGSHLCDRLLEAGHEVVALDNFYTGPRRNVAHLEPEARFALVEHDVSEPLPELGDTFDRIYHLACPASPPQYQRDPVFTLRTSVFGTDHVLQLARRDGARVMLASTSEVYGDPDVNPQTEDYRGNVNPVGPRSCYDEGKRAAETLAMDFHRTRGVDLRIARLFNTYGPRMELDDGRVVSNFLSQAFRGQPLTVYGDGTQNRSFCYVDDMIDGFVGIMEQTSHVGPINIGNPDTFTMLELAEQVKHVVERDTEITFRPLPTDDPRKRCPNITLAREAFGFDPKIPLSEGLRRTAEDFRNRLAR